MRDAKENRGKKWPREILGARSTRASCPQDFTRPFYFAVFFRVTHDGLSARVTTRSLYRNVTSQSKYLQLQRFCTTLRRLRHFRIAIVKRVYVAGRKLPCYINFNKNFDLENSPKKIRALINKDLQIEFTC